MSVQAMTWVIENSKNKGSAFVILLMIANHAHSDGTGSYAGIETLAREARITERQAFNLIPELEHSGELKVERGAGPRGCHLYSLPGMKTFHAQVCLTEKFSPENGGVRISPEPLGTVKEKKNLKRALTSFPEGFSLTEEMAGYANRYGIYDPHAEFEKFENYHRAKASQHKDWVAAWRYWIGNGKRSNGNGKRPESFAERNIRETTEICARVGERAEMLLSEMATGVSKSADGAGSASLFRGLVGPRPGHD